MVPNKSTRVWIFISSNSTEQIDEKFLSNRRDLWFLTRRLLSALGSERLCPENHPNGLSQRPSNSLPQTNHMYPLCLLPHGSRSA
ncbi:9122_t:CDS:2 [Gigaspora margarita]|uniref:9122_t:CDS:1 n=1 Tax=Gigaspora margarita TaxID=4874 RepID=A0ABN7UP02_GIGMA|nr:9122_t:CDS:2 [Gigaspora margarita]